MSNRQCICGNILLSNEVCGCPQSQAVSADKLKLLQPQFGPGTQQEIEHLSQQIDTLLAENAEKADRGEVSQSYTRVLGEHWANVGKGYLSAQVLDHCFKPGDKVRVNVERVRAAAAQPGDKVDKGER